MRRPGVAAALVGALALLGVSIVGARGRRTEPLRFHVELGADAASAIAELGLDVPVVGRVFVIISTDERREPRFQARPRGVPFWGMDVRDFSGGDQVVLSGADDAIVGYPLASTAEIPPGEYYVQAFLNVYTRFARSDGHVVEMHLNSGAGQSPFRAPGNAYSVVRQFHLDPESSGPVRLELSEVISPLEPLEPGESLQQGNPRDEGELVRFVKIRSDLVSEFWGRDMYIGANVLLPADYWANPERRYPAIYYQGHFPGRRVPFGYGARDGGGRGSGFTEFWDSPDSPKMIVVLFRDANPYYDTSYSVNSANVGPYGDALVEELIPYLEAEFRIVAEPWARVLAGGSTGGWEALAMQIFYPDFFGGAWGWCPDPVDFHCYQIVDIYEDENAYEIGGEWIEVERPAQRRTDGSVVMTMRQENGYELAVGPNGRSGGQWAIWEALYSPVGADGYPQRIWDPVTGTIDHRVAEYWREHYDLHEILRRNWPTLGPKLTGKLHFAVGDMDSFYLNNGVHRLEEFLSAVDDPAADASFEYGPRKPHCWIGYSPSGSGADMTNVEFMEVVDEYLKRNRN
ncbi:MAG: alpha/beta hydrolase-fold protein [Gemmatimonadales bacterium]